jgi:hypothetical protein
MLIILIGFLIIEKYGFRTVIILKVHIVYLFVSIVETVFAL